MNVIPRLVLLLVTFIVYLAVSGCGKTGSIEPPTNILKTYPFKNISKEVPYVGSKACRSCHTDIYESFMQTGMGRSLYTPNAENSVEDFKKANTYLDKKSKYRYEMFEKGGEYYQKEFRLDDKGNEIHSIIKKVKYVVGSGNNVRSYITEHNGFVYEMPMSWYTKKKIWDLSPGYHVINQRFSRPIVQECLGCHDSYVSYVEGSTHKYEFPFPEGIGCERCHGPGKLHVQYHLKAGETNPKKGEMDSTIVNPARLNKQEGLDVCQQCHLQGQMFVAKPGMNDDEFRPGMKLSEIRSVFVNAQQMGEGFGIASHPERLSLSRCFKASDMKCLTCHNPHISVYQTPIETFNRKCLTCHEIKKLSGIESKHPHKSSDACVACHMQQGGTENIPHVNFTDHWIRRTLPKRIKEYQPEELLKMGEEDTSSGIIELVDFFEEKDIRSDLRQGIAYYKYYFLRKPKDEYLRRAINILEKSVQALPEEADGHFYLGLSYIANHRYDDALNQLSATAKLDSHYLKTNYWIGYALQQKGSFKEAVPFFEKEISTYPYDPSTFLNLGNCYHALNRHEDAIANFKRALDVNPDFTAALLNLGLTHFESGNFEESEKAYQAAIHTDPDSYDAYFGQGNVYAAKNNLKEAVSNFRKAIKVRPDGIEANANLGYVYLNAGEFTKAKPYFENVLKLHPGDGHAAAALEKIKKMQK